MSSIPQRSDGIQSTDAQMYAALVTCYHLLKEIALSNQQELKEDEAPDPYWTNLQGSCAHASRLCAYAVKQMSLKLFPEPSTESNVN